MDNLPRAKVGRRSGVGQVAPVGRVVLGQPGVGGKNLRLTVNPFDSRAK